MRELVELGHVCHSSAQELPVVAHEHHRALETGDPRLEPLEPDGVEVVRRLVEQYDVEPAEQQRGKPCTRCFATGKCGHRALEQMLGEAERGAHLADPRVEVGPAEGEPMLERLGIEVARAVGTDRKGGSRSIELGLGCTDVGAPCEELDDALAGATFVLLGQVPDDCRRRHDIDCT